MLFLQTIICPVKNTMFLLATCIFTSILLETSVCALAVGITPTSWKAHWRITIPVVINKQLAISDCVQGVVCWHLICFKHMLKTAEWIPIYLNGTE